MAPEFDEIDEDDVCFSEGEYARVLANVTQRNVTRKQPLITQSTKKRILQVQDNSLPVPKRQNASTQYPTTFEPQIEKEKAISYAYEITPNGSHAQNTPSRNLPDPGNYRQLAANSYSENGRRNPYEDFWRSRGWDCSPCSPRSRSEIGQHEQSQDVPSWKWYRSFCQSSSNHWDTYSEEECYIVTVTSEQQKSSAAVNYLGKKEVERYQVGKESCLRYCTTIRD